MKQLLEDAKWMVLSDESKTLSKYAWSHDAATERQYHDWLSSRRTRGQYL